MRTEEWVHRHGEIGPLSRRERPPGPPKGNKTDRKDEYLNHVLKLLVHSGELPEDRLDIRHKTNSFMRTLQRNKDKISTFFRHPQISYTLIQR